MRRAAGFTGVFLGLAGLLTVVMSGCSHARAQTSEVCFKESCVSVELARTPDQMTRGLQKRASLAPDAGMLFMFPVPGLYQFWMKDTLIPLDIIWMNEDHTVIYIAQDVQPCRQDPCPSYGPPRESAYVLEVNGHYVQKHGIAVGDRALFHL